MTQGANKPRRRSIPPSVAFALAFALLGWIAGHSIAYDIVGLLPHDHRGHREPQTHGYLDTLGLTGGVVLVLAFGLSLRAFFQRGTFGEWLREGSIAGNRKQVALATALPAGVFILIEHLERLVAGTGTTPSARLLAVGVFVQLVVGVLCLALVRLTFRVAERAIVSFARNLFPRPSRYASGCYFEGVLFVRLLCPMADSAAGRAPPFPIVSRYLSNFPLLPLR
jgi:hypothetical protein